MTHQRKNKKSNGKKQYKKKKAFSKNRQKRIGKKKVCIMVETLRRKLKSISPNIQNIVGKPAYAVFYYKVTNPKYVMLTKLVDENSKDTISRDVKSIVLYEVKRAPKSWKRASTKFLGSYPYLQRRMTKKKTRKNPMLHFSQPMLNYQRADMASLSEMSNGSSSSMLSDERLPYIRQPSSTFEYVRDQYDYGSEMPISSYAQQPQTSMRYVNYPHIEEW